MQCKNGTLQHHPTFTTTPQLTPSEPFDSPPSQQKYQSTIISPIHQPSSLHPLPPPPLLPPFPPPVNLDNNSPSSLIILAPPSPPSTPPPLLFFPPLPLQQIPQLPLPTTNTDQFEQFIQSQRFNNIISTIRNYNSCKSFKSIVMRCKQHINTTFSYIEPQLHNNQPQQLLLQSTAIILSSLTNMEIYICDRHNNNIFQSTPTLPICTIYLFYSNNHYYYNKPTNCPTTTIDINQQTITTTTTDSQFIFQTDTIWHIEPSPQQQRTVRINGHDIKFNITSIKLRNPHRLKLTHFIKSITRPIQPTTIKCATINPNSLTRQYYNIGNFIQQHDLKLLSIQEHLQSITTIEEEIENVAQLRGFKVFGYGFHNSNDHNTNTRSQGTCILAHKSLNPTLYKVDSTSTTILIHPPAHNQPIIIMCIYIHQGQTFRRNNINKINNTINQLRSSPSTASLPLLIHGDFNSKPSTISSEIISIARTNHPLYNWQLHVGNKQPTHQRPNTTPSTIDNVITNLPTSYKVKTEIIESRQLHQNCHHYPIVTTLDILSSPPPPPPILTSPHPCHDPIRAIIRPRYHYLISMMRTMSVKRTCLENYKTLASPLQWLETHQKIQTIISNPNLLPQQKMDAIVTKLYRQMYKLLSNIIPSVKKRNKKSCNVNIVKSLSTQQRIYARLSTMSKDPDKNLSSSLSTPKYHKLITIFHQIILKNYQRLYNGQINHIVESRNEHIKQLRAKGLFAEATAIKTKLSNFINNRHDEPPTPFQHINDQNGTLATTEQQTIDNFETHLSSFQQQQLQQINQRHQRQDYPTNKTQHSNHASLSTPQQPNNKPQLDCESLLDDFSESEILIGIKSLKPFKSDGAAPFPQELLKCISIRHNELKRTNIHEDDRNIDHFDPLLAIITQLFNMINQYQTQPTIFNNIYVIYLHKPKYPPNEASSYRPISITNNIMKLHNKLIAHRFTRWLIMQGFIAWEQSGFLPKQTRHHHMLSLAHFYSAKITYQQLNDIINDDNDDQQNVIDIINNIIDPHRQIERHIAYLDFSKAFDTIHLDTLYDILECEFNIPTTSRFTKLLQHMFNNVKYRVKGPTTISQPINHIIGTMQGLPLSPIIFICYINSLFIHLRKFEDGFPLTYNNNTKTLLGLNSQGYADDTNLLSITRTSLETKAMEAFKWCYFRNMTINNSKCAIHSIFSANKSDLSFQHPIDNTQITLPYAHDTTPYLGARFSAPLDLVKMLKHDLLPLNIIKQDCHMLHHRNVPLHIKREIIYDYISQGLHNAPLYALIRRKPTIWTEIEKLINERIDKLVKWAWQSYTDRNDISASLQVQYDTIGIPIPTSIITTAFTNVIDNIIINNKLKHHHQSPFALYVNSINDEINYRHLFRKNSENDRSKICAISSTIADITRNFTCQSLQDPDIMSHNTTQYQLKQGVYQNDPAFPIMNPQVESAIYNPRGYEIIGQRRETYLPLMDMSSLLPKYFLNITNNYHFYKPHQPSLLLPHDQRPTTTPFPLNNANISFEPGSSSGIIKYVYYNQHIINNHRKGTFIEPFAKSLIEQIVFNYCSTDRDLTRITRRYPLLQQPLFYLHQMRSYTFHTKSELKFRGETIASPDRTKSKLCFTIPYPSGTHFSMTSSTRPYQYGALYYQPSKNNYTKCQFCTADRSNQHYILECENPIIDNARRLAFDQLHNLLTNNKSFQHLIPQTTTFDNFRTKYRQLVERYKVHVTNLLNSYNMINLNDPPTAYLWHARKWAKRLQKSTTSIFTIAPPIQQIFGFSIYQLLLHNRVIPAWDNAQQYLNTWSIPFPFPQPEHSPCHDEEEPWNILIHDRQDRLANLWDNITSNQFITAIKMAHQINNMDHIQHIYNNDFENWFKSITPPALHQYTPKLRNQFYNLIHNNNIDIRTMHLIWIGLFLQEIRQY